MTGGLAGQIRQRANDEVADAERLRRLRHGGTLHLDRGRAECGVQALTQVGGVDEDVAGQDGAADDARWMAVDGFQLEPARALDHLRQQLAVGGVAKLVGRVEEGQVAGLVRRQASGLGHTGVMLDESVGDDDVANCELRIEATGDTGEDDQSRAQAGNQQRRQDRRRHLADAGLGQDDGVPIERALPGWEWAAERELRSLQRDRGAARRAPRAAQR